MDEECFFNWTPNTVPFGGYKGTRMFSGVMNMDSSSIESVSMRAIFEDRKGKQRTRLLSCPDLGRVDADKSYGNAMKPLKCRIRQRNADSKDEL